MSEKNNIFNFPNKSRTPEEPTEETLPATAEVISFPSETTPPIEKVSSTEIDAGKVRAIRDFMTVYEKVHPTFRQEPGYHAIAKVAQDYPTRELFTLINTSTQEDIVKDTYLHDVLLNEYDARLRNPQEDIESGEL